MEKRPLQLQLNIYRKSSHLRGEFVSEIPVSVEQIVFKCCQKSPDRRYQSMGELIVDLKKSLMNPDEDFVKVVDPDEEGSHEGSKSDREMVSIKKQYRDRESMEDAMHLRRERDVKREAVAVPTAVIWKKPDDYDTGDEDDYDPKMELTTILAVVAAILIGAIILFLVGKTLGVFDFGGNKEENVQEE